MSLTKEEMREYQKRRRMEQKVAASPVTKEGGAAKVRDKEKFPEAAAWEIAEARAERAGRYAKMFPHLIGPEDMKFQDVIWQYENEGLPAVGVKR